MAAKTTVKRRFVRIRGRRGGAKKQPHNMAIVWCLIGALLVGLLVALSQSGDEQETKVLRHRTKSVVKKVVKTEQPASQKVQVVESEPESEPAPEPEEEDEQGDASEEQTQPEPVVPPVSLGTPEPPETPNAPGVPLPNGNSEEDEEEEESEKSREDMLNATAPNGEYYIDMKTRSLLFTEDSSLNDENLELYLEATYAATESERYDEEAAERPDENKQVK